MSQRLNHFIFVGKDIRELIKTYGSDRMSLLSCVRRMPKEQKERVKEKIMQDQLLRENINRR